MKYFKNIFNGYIVSVSTQQGQTEISQEEYNIVLARIKSMPKAPQGFEYRLKANLTWELVRMPEEELTDE